MPSLFALCQGRAANCSPFICTLLLLSVGVAVAVGRNATWEFDFVEYARLPLRLETGASLELSIVFGAGDDGVPEDLFLWPCGLPEPTATQHFCFGKT
jgi:hypothetical protein